MIDQESLIEIASGERRGWVAASVRSIMWMLSKVYGLVIFLRNRKFDRGTGVHQAEVPVVSIGNLTTGGTGKSPLVIWVSQYLRSRGLRVAVLSRGYKAAENQTADEAKELQQRLPDVPHLQNPNRVDSARIAVDELEMEVLVLDDAFQHRKLARNLNIVVVDCTLPFGFGYLLPRGLLREPVSSLSRADLVVLNRADQVTESELHEIRQQIEAHTTTPIAVTQTKPAYLLQADGQTKPIETLGSSKVVGFCGIGNPGNFWQTLDDLNLNVRAKLPFVDHHDYERQDVKKIGELAGRHKADAIICTHKDLVKVEVNQIQDVPVYALIIEVAFVSGEGELNNAIDEAIENFIPPNR